MLPNGCAPQRSTEGREGRSPTKNSTAVVPAVGEESSSVNNRDRSSSALLHISICDVRAESHSVRFVHILLARETKVLHSQKYTSALNNVAHFLYKCRVWHIRRSPYPRQTLRISHGNVNNSDASSGNTNSISIYLKFYQYSLLLESYHLLQNSLLLCGYPTLSASFSPSLHNLRVKAGRGCSHTSLSFPSSSTMLF